MGKMTVYPLNSGYLPLTGGKMSGSIDGIPDIVRTPEYGSDLGRYGGFAVNKRYADSLALNVVFLPTRVRGYAAVSVSANALDGTPGSFRAIVMRKEAGTITGIEVIFPPSIAGYMQQHWRTAQAFFLFQDGTEQVFTMLTGTVSGSAVTYSCSLSLRTTVFAVYMTGTS